MDTTSTQIGFTALPGSLRTQLDLPANAASHLLKLRPGQTALLQVTLGSLWLTRDGYLDDTVLQHGAQLLLKAPGRYRLGAFGPADASVITALAP